MNKEVIRTCIWRVGSDHTSVGPILAFRSDRRGRTVWYDESNDLIRRYKPEWRVCRVTDVSAKVDVCWAKINLASPVPCGTCGQKVPSELIRPIICAPAVMICHRTFRIRR
jgi:hypothetical protein